MGQQVASAEQVFRAVLGARGDELGARPRTFMDLDWAHLQRRLASHTVTGDARELAEIAGLLPDDVWPRRRVEVHEMAGLLARGAAPPVHEVPSLRHVLVRAARVDALEAEDLIAIATVIEIAHRMRRHGLAHEQGAPLYAEHASRFTELAELASAIRVTFDPAGRIVDEASPELGRLRRRARRLRDSILARMDRFFKTPRFEGILQDEYVTLREDRYVLPVRAGERGDMPGIVHGASGSGATLFIEPEELVPLNNDLQVAQAEVRAEERRILIQLTRMVRDWLEAIELNADLLVFIDLTVAHAQLARELDATLIRDASPTAPLRLLQARHPLLALRTFDGELEVVPNDIDLDPATRALVISGPNTGGKTVVLKTLGLFVLMTRAGMLLPCDANSSLPVFQDVFTDIGDGQSIQGDLSTFSGHVAQIASFAREAGAGSLVLIDEIFSGTDPMQGTALGRALIDFLVDNGAFVVVTTHLEGLKAISFEDPRYASASMGFDIERFQPTWRLRIGTPGASWALRIAQRLGMPEEIILRAEHAHEHPALVQSEELIARMEDAWQQVFEERERARQLREDAERSLASAEAERKKARQRDEEAAASEAATLRRELQGLRQQLREATRAVKKVQQNERPLTEEEQAALESAREIARQVDERTRAALRSEEGSADGVLDWSQLRKGTEVWVIPFQMYGVVVEEPMRGQKIGVQMGAVHALFLPDQLRLRSSEGARATPDPASMSRMSRPAAERTLDLRGARVDDALEVIEAFIERGVLSSMYELLIIHGHGTGALKRAIRTHLRALPWKLSFRPGESGEGGDGVTVVTLPTSSPEQE